jgi:hypothetical protein
MNTENLALVNQAAWKVRLVDFICRWIGLLAHVEGIPVGSIYSPAELRILRKHRADAWERANR